MGIIRKMKNNSLAKNAVFNIVYKVLNVFFPLISTAYVARVLSADGVGTVSAVNNNVSYFLILATLGIPAYGLREIAKYRDREEKITELFSELFTINFLLTIITCMIYCSVILACSYFHQELPLYFILGLNVLLNILNVDWFFQGIEEYQYIAVRSLVVKAISIISIFVLVKSKTDIYVYALIQVLSLSGNYIFNIIRIRKNIHFLFNGNTWKKHTKSLIYLALCSVSTEIYAKIDITMLDVLKDSNAVGYYVSSQKIINLIITALVAVTAVFMPRLSYFFEVDKKKFNVILKAGLELMITISLPASVGVIFISKPLVLTVLGVDFIGASKVLVILSIMIPLKCVGDLVCYQIMMCARQESILMKSYFFIMIINLFNNIVFIPEYGAVGASLASVISEILAFIFVLHHSRKYVCINGIKCCLRKTIMATLIMSVMIVFLNSLYLECYYQLFVDLIVGTLVYLLSGVFLKHEVVIRYMGFLRKKMFKK